MAQLGDTIITGNLSTTGTIYGTVCGHLRSTESYIAYLESCQITTNYTGTTDNNLTIFIVGQNNHAEYYFTPKSFNTSALICANGGIVNANGCSLIAMCDVTACGYTTNTGTVTVSNSISSSDIPVALCTGTTSIGKSNTCGLTFVPSTGTLTAKTFSGKLSGCATRAGYSACLYNRPASTTASGIGDVCFFTGCTNASCCPTNFAACICGTDGKLYGLKGLSSVAPSASTNCSLTICVCCCNASALCSNSYVFSATDFTANGKICAKGGIVNSSGTAYTTNTGTVTAIDFQCAGTSKCCVTSSGTINLSANAWNANATISTTTYPGACKTGTVTAIDFQCAGTRMCCVTSSGIINLCNVAWGGTKVEDVTSCVRYCDCNAVLPFYCLRCALILDNHCFMAVLSACVPSVSSGIKFCGMIHYNTTTCKFIDSDYDPRHVVCVVNYSNEISASPGYNYQCIEVATSKVCNCSCLWINLKHNGATCAYFLISAYIDKA